MPTVHYLWDELDDNILAEYDDAGSVIAEYTHEPGLHGQLISQYRNGQTYFHHYDGEGNTREVTDQNGNVVETATYSAFGEVVQKTSSIVNPFGYKGALGYYANPVTNDLDVRARIYKPPLARWLSTDPLGFEPQREVKWLQFLESLAKPYIYVSNNPINWSDPSVMHIPEDLNGHIPVQFVISEIGSNDCAAGDCADQVGWPDRIDVDKGSEINPRDRAGCSTDFHGTHRDIKNPKSKEWLVKCPGYTEVIDVFRITIGGKQQIFQVKHCVKCTVPDCFKDCMGKVIPCQVRSMSGTIGETKYTIRRCQCQKDSLITPPK